MNSSFKPLILGLSLACAFFSEVASSLPRAYIANAADGTVSVIDTGTRTVIATIAVGPNPTHVAVNEQGTRAYVRNGETVSVIDTSNNTVIASPVIPGGVLFLNGDGSRLFSHNDFFGNIFAIDTSNYALLATYTIPSPNSLRGFVVNRQGNFAYVTEAVCCAGVLGLNLISNSWTGPVTTGLGPEALVLNRSGILLYVVNTGDDTLSVVNASTFSSIRKIPITAGADEIAINPDGNRIYVTYKNINSVNVIDAVTNNEIASIPLDSAPSGLTVNPADNSVYVTLPQANSVAVIDAGTNAVVATISVGNNPISTGIFIPQYLVAQADLAIRAYGAASVTPGSLTNINVIMDNYGPDLAVSPSVLLETNAPGTSIDATAPNGWTCIKSVEAEKASFVCNALGNMIAGNKPSIKLHFFAPNSMAYSKLVITSQISSESKETNVTDNTNRFSIPVTAPRKIRPPFISPAASQNRR